jgi:hypothetical protein
METVESTIKKKKKECFLHVGEKKIDVLLVRENKNPGWEQSEKVNASSFLPHNFLILSP